ncbi:MAG: hypothetical protein JWN56_1848 [Sphingobacteriales bacterium]|nr:hypothetical protein [Sphingobacteriales bacterium]
MVEVFKTNVTDRQQANILIREIHLAFSNYKANFDLEDCDNILRIECNSANICIDYILSLLNEFGFYAEVLPDEIVDGMALMFKQ